jgi:hypothetical protein
MNDKEQPKFYEMVEPTHTHTHIYIYIERERESMKQLQEDK